MSEPKKCRETSAAIFAAFWIAALTGCSSGAHREVYQQKLASEVRVLEDQLYEADYHNRVLSDELERCRVKADSGRGSNKAPTSHENLNHSAVPPKSSVGTPIPIPIPSRDTGSGAFEGGDSGKIQMDSGFDDDQLELPSFDSGEPVNPDALTDPIPLPEAIPVPGAIPLPEGESPDSAGESLPAPGLPQPPGKLDTIIPQIDPGEVLPPPVGGQEDQSDQPGKIELPDSLGKSSGAPEELRIHTGLTSGITGDGESNQMTIIIFVVDDLGRPVNLDDYQIDANLSVVLLDPSREATDARVGRWDFTREQIAQFIRQEPISGFQVPVKWYGDRPVGKQVVVHARLRAEDDEMRCERRLDVNKKEAIAEWTPRGDDLQR